MKTMVLELPEFAFIVATRAALGLGIGFLAAGRYPADRRRTIGSVLVAVGAAATIPALMTVVRGLRRSKRRAMPSGVDVDPHLIGATRFPRKGDDYAG
jgi:hypothetical protein